MKKAVSLLILTVMCILAALPAGAATFESDSGIALKAPLIKASLATSNHPDTTEVYDFNSKTMSVFLHQGNSKYNQISQPQWVNGASGQDGDWAAYFKAKTNDKFALDFTYDTGNQLYLIYDTSFGDSIINWQGKQIIEFDVKADNTNGRLDFVWWYLWHSSNYQILGNDGKVKGTDYYYPIGEWFHIKMVLENHVWNVYATDSEGEHCIVNNVDAVGKNKPGNTWSQGSRMAFLFNQPNEVPSEEERMGFALDNLHFYRLYPKDPSNDISNFFMMSYAEADGTYSAELPDTGKVLLDFGAVPDASLFDTENIVLTDSDGSDLEYSGSYENNVYTVAPSEKLIQASKYKLKVSDQVRRMLSPDAPPSGSIILSVRDDRPIVLGEPTGQSAPEAGSEFALDVPVINRESADKNVGAVLCLYNAEGGLAAISRKNINAPQGETTFQLSLNVPDDYDYDFGFKVFLTEGSGIRILDEKNIL